MSLTLVVPGLLDLSATVLSAIDSQAAGLGRLLASADSIAEEEDGLIASACRACGIAKQRDWPVAPCLARAAGIDPGEAYWLCATPVTLAVGADDVRLAALVDDLSDDEAQGLVAALNEHFANDGLVFFDPMPSSWYVRAAQPQQLRTRPPEAALATPLFEFLPAGPDAARWRRWQSEVQMLLFEIPVNQRRERRGAAPVNSVWFWGGGVDSPHARPATSVFARGQRIVELAKCSGTPCSTLPAGFDALPGGDGAVWLDAVEPGLAAQQLETIDRAWMAPLERALAAGALSTAELVVAGRARALRFTPRRSSLAQRWRAWKSPPRCSQILGVAGEPALP
jgi:hypothetical protein